MPDGYERSDSAASLWMLAGNVAFSFATASFYSRVNSRLFRHRVADIGVGPGSFATAMVLWDLLYQYWIHTEAIDRLPKPIEAVFNTPSHHRVHHGANPQYLDKNYAGILIVWDKLFGTFEPEVRRVKYGLTKNIKTFNPVRIAYHEFADIGRDVVAARGWRNKLGHVFRRPGWQPAP